MLIVPQLDEIQNNILKVINDNKFKYTDQIEKIEAYISSIPGHMQLEGSYLSEQAISYLNHLYNQGFISNPRIAGVSGYVIGPPIMLTAIGNGYLETGLKMEELMDLVLARLNLPLAEHSKIKNKLISGVKDAGIDFLVKLIVEGIRSTAGG